MTHTACTHRHHQHPKRNAFMSLDIHADDIPESDDDSTNSESDDSIGGDEGDVSTSEDVSDSEVIRGSNLDAPERVFTPKHSDAAWDMRFRTSPSKQRSDGKCCAAGCCSEYESTGAGAIIRRYVRTLKPASRRAFISARMSQKRARHADDDSEETDQYGRRITTLYMENPKDVLHDDNVHLQASRVSLRRVCTQCFLCLLCGVSTNVLYQPGVQGRMFRETVNGGQESRRRTKPGKAASVTMWLLALAALYQHDPTSGHIFLPFTSKKMVWEMYQEDAKSGQPDSMQYFVPGVAKRARFFMVWHKSVKHVKLRRWLRFALCDDCVYFREQRWNTRDKKEIAKLMALERTHYIFVKDERLGYMLRRALAEAPSTRPVVMSVIIDGADQSCYGLPYHFLATHATQGAWKIKTHLMGAIVHGRQVYAYTYIDNIKHGNNITIETLHRVIVDTWAREDALPRKLNLQLDNTSKQCKGKYLLGYLACLVEWGVFEEVELCFLPVGHTHEDIDQFFSRVAVYLRKNNARSRQEMHEAVQNSYTSKMNTRPITESMENAANFSDWLDQGEYLACTAMRKRTKKKPARAGISQFHQFKFHTMDNQTVMQVRNWSSAPLDKDPWRGLRVYPAASTHKANKPYHVVFDKAPKAADLRDCPPAQRKDVEKEKLQEFERKTTADLKKIFKARKVPEACQKDILHCQKLIMDRSPLPFDWDTSVYEHFEMMRSEENPDRLLTPSAAEDADDRENVESASESEGETGFSIDCTIGNFVLVVPDKVTDDTPFAVGQIKSAELVDSENYPYRWMLWYERRGDQDTDAYTDTYVATKVKSTEGDLRLVNQCGWQQVYSSSIAAVIGVVNKGKGNHYKKLAKRCWEEARDIAAQIAQQQVIPEGEEGDEADESDDDALPVI